MNKYSLSALAAAGLLAGGLASSVNAADLGGNCCADLEERVAELEATTARKGNRKVSLTISGWVAEQVTYWDDGVESNAYVGGIGTTLATNVKFTGQAQIAPGWTAGYVLHLEADGSDTLAGTDATRSAGGGLYTGTTNYVQTLQSYWFIKSDHLGKVGVGLQSMVSDNLAILVDGSGSLVPANWVSFDVGGFAYRNQNGDPSSTFIITGGGCNGGGDCYGVPVNSIRYDSPTFAGFSVSAAWGEDDIWDIGGRYAGEMHGFKLAAAVGYGEVTGGNKFPQGIITGLNGATLVDPDNPFGPYNRSILFAPDSSYFQVGAYAQHVRTGLFLLVNYGDLDVDGLPNSETWYVKAGIRAKCHPLGATVFYGEWDENNDGAGAGSESQWWGLGVVQEVDAAAMSLWLSYRQFSAEEATATRDESLQDFDMIKFGALINF
jgi:hypothetical protein